MLFSKFINYGKAIMNCWQYISRYSESWKGWNTLSLSCCQTFPLAKRVFSFNSPRKTDRLLITSTSHRRSERSFPSRFFPLRRKYSKIFFLEQIHIERRNNFYSILIFLYSCSIPTFLIFIYYLFQLYYRLKS